ncbi:tol-pal system protein YbgF [methane-oxidizing endosymbiont of Gigantopelta aegis]|uniref:tol-pal system protein YbgF n=1 Tax=methane-oxidizing endosymbiont of Gigantopelta aegis TaxID=2794938 RepID=UPI0018DB4D06|nr:tol-pal system protein YbgF [methane-oxidizing endosymbiont of Gigantopelta aegis]
MNKKLLLLLSLISNVNADVRPLPPVVDNSMVSNGAQYTHAAPANGVVFELLGRIEQLQREVQELRGMVEEQGYQLSELKKRQNNIYTDLDQRLQALANGQPLPQNTIQHAGTEAVQSQQAETQAETSAPAQISDKDDYQKAYELLRNGHNSQAIKAFKAFIQQFPASEYADNAQYWLGEAYKVNQQPELAKAAFQKVIEQYPDSSKVPDALLKLGYIAIEQNNLAKARDYLTRVKVDYPGTAAAHLAEKRLLRLDRRL